MNEITIKIQGLEALTEAVNRLAGAGQNTVPPSAPAQMPPMASLPAAPPVSIQPSQMPPQMLQPPVQQTPSQVPTTAAAQGYTIEQLQVAAAGLTGAGKTSQVLGILQQFGIQAMTELPREQYGNFALALREAGAQI